MGGGGFFFALAAGAAAASLCLLWPALAATDYKSVDTVVKIFDATSPSVAFCEESYYAQSQASVSRILFDIGEFLNFDRPAVPTSPPIQAPTVPKLLEDHIRLSAASSMYAGILRELKRGEARGEMPPDGTVMADIVKGTPGSKERLAVGIAEGLGLTSVDAFVPSFARGAPHNAKDFVVGGRRLNVTEEAAVVPAGILDLISTQIMARLIDCIVADNSFRRTSIVPFIYQLQISSTNVNLGECMCDSLEIGHQRNDTLADECGLLDLVVSALACQYHGVATCNEVDPPVTPSGFASCSEASPPAGSNSPDPNVDYDLYLHPKTDIVADGEPMPDILPDAIATDEGLTYYYMYRANLIASKFTAAAPCGTVDIPELVPGWKTDLIVNNVQEGNEMSLEGRGSTPFAVISRRNCDVLMTLRGTANAFEWRMDFTYNQIFGGLSNVGVDTSPRGRVHHGFGALMSSTLPAFATYYQDVLASCVGESKRLLITGHSLGGGVGTVMAHYLAVLLQSQEVAVSAVLFAPPLALDSVGKEQFSIFVNSRAIKADLDPVSYLPCPKDLAPSGLMLCPGGNVKNGPQSERVTYEPIGGAVWIGHTDLSSMSNDTRWQNSNIADLEINVLGQSVTGNLMDSAIMQFVAHHVCSYSCYLGQYCRDPAQEQWSCSDNSITGGVPNIDPCPFVSIPINVTL